MAAPSQEHLERTYGRMNDREGVRDLLGATSPEQHLKAMAGTAGAAGFFPFAGSMFGTLASLPRYHANRKNALAVEAALRAHGPEMSEKELKGTLEAIQQSLQSSDPAMRQKAETVLGRWLSVAKEQNINPRVASSELMSFLVRGGKGAALAAAPFAALGAGLGLARQRAKVVKRSKFLAEAERTKTAESKMEFSPQTVEAFYDELEKIAISGMMANRALARRMEALRNASPNMRQALSVRTQSQVEGIGKEFKRRAGELRMDPSMPAGKMRKVDTEIRRRQGEQLDFEHGALYNRDSLNKMVEDSRYGVHAGYRQSPLLKTKTAEALLLEHEIRGRVIAHAFFSELEKVANAVVGDAGMGGVGEQSGPLAGGVQNEAQADAAGGVETIQNEAMPAHGVVASRVAQLDPRRAVAIPVLQPPPGYVYNPELAAFVPNQGDPGWMAQEDTMEAARNKGWYEAGQQDLTTQQAQQNLDGAVEADIQQANMEAQQAQTQEQQAAAASQESMMTAARESGKIQGQQAAGGSKPKTPSDSSSKPKKSKSSGGKGGNGGVHIRIGR